jgi:hypothetical protein
MDSNVRANWSACFFAFYKEVALNLNPQPAKIVKIMFQQLVIHAKREISA